MPVLSSFGYFTARYCGISNHEFLFDYEKSAKAILKTSVDFQYDTGAGMSMLGALPLTLAFLNEYDGLVPGLVNGPIHDILGVRYARFPGREVGVDAPFQFIGEEYMKATEYDDLTADPQKFIAEKLLPRSLRNLGNPGSAKGMATLFAWGEECRRSAEAGARLADDLRSHGFPGFTSGMSYAPLDFIGDFLRDIKNVLLDCYRVPDKVKQATEAMRDLIVEMVRISVKGKKPGSIQFIPMHLNEYFSPKQYSEFYWPTLKEVVEEMIKLGVTPELFYEGRHAAHLETILELPKGKTISRFEKTDLAKAKEIIGDHSCIIGGPPSSIFLGPAEKIDPYVKELFDGVKDGGGFMLSPAVSVPAAAKPENVKALMDAAIKHGSY
ncbi:hypothetical protein JXL21_07625 [Candidatus Bathyarchaeota archaeon]|nr:hypothetical protein [Candidatus Bathyarchaeota archaeon]